MKILLLRFLLGKGILRRKIGWRITHTEYTVSGYLDKQDVRIQRIVKRTYFLGLSISQSVLKSEVVPSFAWIQESTVGSTTWKSELPRQLFNHKIYPVFKSNFLQQILFCENQKFLTQNT